MVGSCRPDSLPSTPLPRLHQTRVQTLLMDQPLGILMKHPTMMEGRPLGKPRHRPSGKEPQPWLAGVQTSCRVAVGWGAPPDCRQCHAAASGGAGPSGSVRRPRCAGTGQRVRLLSPPGEARPGQRGRRGRRLPREFQERLSARSARHVFSPLGLSAVWRGELDSRGGREAPGPRAGSGAHPPLHPQSGPGRILSALRPLPVSATVGVSVPPGRVGEGWQRRAPIGAAGFGEGAWAPRSPAPGAGLGARNSPYLGGPPYPADR